MTDRVKFYRVRLVALCARTEAEHTLALWLYPYENATEAAAMAEELEQQVEYGEWHDVARNRRIEIAGPQDFRVCWETLWGSPDFVRDLFESGGLDELGVG